MSNDIESANEQRRLSELKAYGLLDTENEPAFDDIVRSAARRFGVPIALISLIDEDRQWFKARHGLAPSETPRTISFCTHAIEGAEVFVVEDAKRDLRFADNPLVKGDPRVRFYAGAPLKTGSGRRIGTLCIIDTSARATFSQEARDALEAMAAEVMQAVDERQVRRAADARWRKGANALRESSG
jgi:GAF domain-containing protein